MELRAVIETVAGWSTVAESVRAHRERIEQTALHSLAVLHGAAIAVPRDGINGWRAD